jgi:hypothetical protein
LRIEIDADFHQFPDSLGTADHHLVDHVRMAQAVTGIQGVLNVQVEGVLLVEDGGDAPWARLVLLSTACFLVTMATVPWSATLRAYHQSGDAAADDEKISWVSISTGKSGTCAGWS